MVDINCKFKQGKSMKKAQAETKAKSPNGAEGSSPGQRPGIRSTQVIRAPRSGVEQGLMAAWSKKSVQRANDGRMSINDLRLQKYEQGKSEK